MFYSVQVSLCCAFFRFVPVASVPLMLLVTLRTSVVLWSNVDSLQPPGTLPFLLLQKWKLKLKNMKIDLCNLFQMAQQLGSSFLHFLQKNSNLKNTIKEYIYFWKHNLNQTYKIYPINKKLMQWKPSWYLKFVTEKWTVLKITQ